MPEFSPHMDRRQELTAGTHSAGTTTWTLLYADPSINCLIIGSGASVGTVITSPTLNTSTYPFTVAVTGNYNGATACVGVTYEWYIIPTKPIRIRQDGTPDFTSKMSVRYLDVAYHLSSGFTVRRAMTSRADTDKAFAGNSDGSVTAKGVFRAHLNGNTTDAVWSIRSTSPKRVVVPSIEYLTDIDTRRDG